MRQAPEAISPSRSSVKPASLFESGAPRACFRQHFTPGQANLLYLSCGELELPPGTESQAMAFADVETLLFTWQGAARVTVDGCDYALSPYDTLYVPLGSSWRAANGSDSLARIVACSAPGAKVHSPFHSRFADFSRQETRIRRLKGKDVYMMFDVSEPADKLVAGYTFFQPNQRSWPPHNHTDQEEVYFFLKGHGAMEVYESPEKLSFVRPVKAGDIVTIPFLNYHPVFSQESPLEFIWCIAGERYWVGDKRKEFMSGSGPALTT